MNRRNFGLLQIRYDKESLIGEIIEDFKNDKFNSSQTIRNYILYLNGYNYLKDGKIDKQELKRICIASYQFLVTQSEISKMNLKEENIQLDLNCESQENQEYSLFDKNKIQSTKSPSKDKTLITSLLPK